MSVTTLLLLILVPRAPCRATKTGVSLMRQTPFYLQGHSDGKLDAFQGYLCLVSCLRDTGSSGIEILGSIPSGFTVMGKKLHFPGPPFICSFATRGEEDAAGRVLDGQTSMPESVGPMAGLGATEPEQECRPRLAVCRRPQKDSWGVQIPTTDVCIFESCLFFVFVF